MAKPRMDLTAFVGKLLEEQDGDVLREGIRVLSQALMETEVAGLIGAERHERSGDRTAYRNGSRTRTWDTRMGTIELAIPKVRPGTYFPSLLQPRRRAEHALLAVVQEAYVHGVSTRKVDDLVKALGLDGISKSEVSRICGDLDPIVAAFRTRALTGEHRYLWVDATYHKVRVDGRVISQATVVAIGITSEGDRRVLGIDVGPSEDRAFWTAFLRSLEVPYRYGSETRRYLPDFIVRLDEGRGIADPLNLVVEIKGYRREDAKERKSTMDTYWVPGVNHLGTYGRWEIGRAHV